MKILQLLVQPKKIPGRVKKILRQRRAMWHRARLDSFPITWIAVTGSCGKSTTVHLLARMLSLHGCCPEPGGGGNYTGTVPLAILGVKHSDRYVVQELGTHVPGSIRRLARMVKPHIGVVMNVGTDHYTQFKSQDAIAEEKADLVRALPADGIVVLNADDPRVSAMAAQSKARVVTFGIANAADYRACDVTSAWPGTVSFVLEHGDEHHRVETSLFGAHLAPNVLASLAVAHIVGMPLATAISAVREVKPIGGRMSEVRAAGGVTFIRDDYKAPWWGLPLTVDFVREATAGRKILVLGELSDNPGNKATKFRRFINSALDHADLVVVAGPAETKLNKSLREHGRVEVCPTVEGANRFLSGWLQAGDLVVIKGNIADHLERLAHSRSGKVGCWRNRCSRALHCTVCDQLAQPAGTGEPL